MKKNKIMKKKILIGIILLTLSNALGMVVTGTDILSSAEGLDKIGFLFNSGSVTDINGDFYYYEEALWVNTGEGGIKYMEWETFESLTSCDYGGYEKSNVAAIEGYVYCIKTKDGSYAKIHIIEKTIDSITFIWSHQRDGTQLFVGVDDSGVQSEAGEEEMELGLTPIILVIVLLLFVILLLLIRNVRKGPRVV